MGLPAEKRTSRPVTGPRLKVVRRRHPRSAPRAGGRAGRDAFAAFLALCAIMTLFGLGRVALSARAFEASLEAGQLQEQIKDEQLEGDLLEVDRSALATPSRIEQVAGATMRMAEAGHVTYLEIDASPATDGGRSAETLSQEGAASVLGDEEEAAAGVERILAAVKGLAASEVQSLLVGDVGLASSR